MDYKFKAEPTPVNIKVDGKVVQIQQFIGEYEPGNLPVATASEEHAADDIILKCRRPRS